MNGFASRAWNRLHDFLSSFIVKHPAWTVLIVAVAVMFVNLGGPRLWDRDEPRNAGCAAEMLAANDWVTPQFNGELRSHKPVLLYWLMMPGYAVAGANEFTARMPSALLAVGTALMVLFIGRRLFSPRIGLLAAVLLTTSMMFVVAGRAATPDSVLIFLTTAATAIFVAYAFPKAIGAIGAIGVNDPVDVVDRVDRVDVQSSRTIDDAALPWRVAIGMYSMMGLAMLAKGPVGLILPTAVIGMFLLVERLPAEKSKKSRGIFTAMLHSFHPLHFLKTCWWMRPITALAVSLAIALPWYIWVGIRTDGAWLEGFFLEHNLGRAMQPMESHGGGPWYYPAAILAGFFPWSIFLAPSLLTAWSLSSQRSKEGSPPNESLSGTAEQRGVMLACCWIGVYVGLFTIARTKLPSYVTPCYPGLALLTAWQLDRWAAGLAPARLRWIRFGLAIVAVVGIGILIGVPFAASQLLPGEQWLAVGGIVPLLVALAGWRLVSKQKNEFVRVFAVGAVAWAIVLFALLPNHVSKHQHFDHLLNVARAQSDSPQLAVYRCMEPSWVFYARQRIGQVWLPDHPDEWETRTEANRTRWSPDPVREDMGQFLADEDAFVITTRWQYDEMREYLPPGTRVIASTPLFLKKTDLLLLSRHATVAGVPHSPRR